MKKLLFLLTFLFSSSAFAQDAVINLALGNEGKTVTFWGTVADAITDTGTEAYVFQLNSPFTLDAYIQTSSTRVTGYTKVVIAIEESMDNVTYYAITNIPNDTLKAATGIASTLVRTAVDAAKITAKYLRITAKGIDSTQHNHLSGMLKVVRKFDNL